MQWFRKVIEMGAPAAAPNLELPADDLMATVADDTQDRHDEKGRLKAIMCCAEAVGREALANHLALETNLSVSDAKATLLASPNGGTLAPTDPRAVRVRELDANFTAAFNRAAYAADETPVGEPETAVERISRNYQIASGLPVRQ